MPRALAQARRREVRRQRRVTRSSSGSAGPRAPARRPSARCAARSTPGGAGRRDRAVRRRRPRLPASTRRASPPPDERVERFLDAIRRADGIVICSPGYHGGVSGLVKNAIDWVEELRDGRAALLRRPPRRADRRRRRLAGDGHDAHLAALDRARPARLADAAGRGGQRRRAARPTRPQLELLARSRCCRALRRTPAADERRAAALTARCRSAAGSSRVDVAELVGIRAQVVVLALAVAVLDVGGGARAQRARSSAGRRSPASARRGRWPCARCGVCSTSAASRQSAGTGAALASGRRGCARRGRRSGRAPGQLVERRREVGVLDERVDLAPAGTPGPRTMNGTRMSVVERGQLARQQPVLAHVEAVVGAEDRRRCLASWPVASSWSSTLPSSSSMLTHRARPLAVADVDAARRGPRRAARRFASQRGRVDDRGVEGRRARRPHVRRTAPRCRGAGTAGTVRA